MDWEVNDTQENEPTIETQPENNDIIEPINRKTVHRICSGQVVLSLAIAIKELVENAIDASATSVEVRLKDYGSELVEVTDNGSGVRQENFQALTLKHYTSKLREFSDLESVGTLGFRGEALSSLCALADLTITTRHAMAEHGTKIQYDLNGKIVSESPAAREVGTTVTLENLFFTLPVRRKEFNKNLKREYSKMCQLLYAYCLVSKGIKFTCTNQTKAGSRSTVVATEGASSVRENIMSIFGARQIPSLTEVEMVEPEEQILEEYKVKTVPGESLPFKFECIISSASHGSGRSTSDRQFFYINSRPCEPHKIAKLVNEVYRQFNTNQYPFVFLNVEMQRSLVDVNVTPDKRQIFLEKEKLLLAVLKSSLLEAFKSCPSTYQVQNISNHGDWTRETRGVKRGLSDSTCFRELGEVKEGSILDLFKKRTKSDKGAMPKAQNGCWSPAHVKQSTLKEIKDFNITTQKSSSNEGLDRLVSLASKLEKDSGTDTMEFESSQSSEEQLACKLHKDADTEVTVDSSFTIESSPPEEHMGDSHLSDSILEHIKMEDLDDLVSQTLASSQGVSNEEDVNTKCVVEEHDANSAEIDKPPRKTVTVRSSMKYLQEALDSCQVKEADETVRVRFRSEITPAANKSAEQELQRQISKDMFKKMEIVGQFNLGFIITRLENDLFVIDQHATDEKYNFEQLQLSTVLESQILVNPKPLELTAANEEILMENEEVFRKNGFSFSINANAPATKKVSLTAIPISRNYVFGKDDIEEMLFMLQEDVNHATCRPSRVRAMFASRACRKSVMVGCPLSRTDMRRLVDHMGEIDQPWNCPHGRPTMRHLINLKLIQNS